MRRPAITEALETLLVVAGLAALAMTGRPDGVLAVLAIPVAIVGPAVRDRLPAAVRHVLAVCTGLGVVGAFAAGLGVEVAVGLGVVGLTLHQRLLPPWPGADRVLLLLVTLLLVAAAAGTRSPGFLPAWALWGLALPRALAGGAGRARWVYAGVVVPLAVLLFVVLPRRPSVRLAAAEGLVGLSDEVRLATPSRLREDPAEVARVRFLDGGDEPVVLRAAALEDFDGQRWTAAAPLRPAPVWSAGPGRTVTVEHASLAGVVLVPGGIVRFDRASFDQDVGEGWHGPREGRVAYTAEVRLDRPLGAPRLRPYERERALALPARLDPRLTELAIAWTGTAAAPVDRVRALVEALADFRYTRSVPPGGEDPLAAFLFDHRSGHCELFAAALAVLARLDGVPARVVTGFVGGVSEGGDRVFRGSDAHAWVEVHLDGQGWVAVDPTPGAAPPRAAVDPPLPRPATGGAALASREPVLARLERAWDQHVVGFDREAQRGLWSAVAAWVPWRAAVGVAVALGLVVLLPAARSLRPGAAGTWRGARPQGVAGAWVRARTALSRRGLVPPAELGPLDAGDWLAARLPGEAAVAVRRLAWLHVEVRFGGADPVARQAEADRLARLLCRPPAGGAPRAAG